MVQLAEADKSSNNSENCPLDTIQIFNIEYSKIKMSFVFKCFRNVLSVKALGGSQLESQAHNVDFFYQVWVCNSLQVLALFFSLEHVASD